MPAVMTFVHRITLSYRSLYWNVPYSNVTCTGLQWLWEIAESRTLDFWCGGTVSPPYRQL